MCRSACSRSRAAWAVDAPRDTRGPWRFDHGAQYFTVRDPRLAPLIRSWHQRGVIAQWQGALAVRENGEWQSAKTGVRRWVAVPGMNALGAHIALDLDVTLHTQVAHVQREGRQWRLIADGGGDLGTFDSVLACIPAPQVHQLLSPVAPELVERAQAAVMHPTMATMLVLGEPVAFPWAGAFINDDAVLGWISRDASKPGRGAAETWVLHANRAWSQQHVEDSPESIAATMTTRFSRLLVTTRRRSTRVAHRWRYALPDPVTTEAAIFDPSSGLGAGGDWCGGPRIEGALLSGIALAGRVMTHAQVASHAAGSMRFSLAHHA